MGAFSQFMRALYFNENSLNSQDIGALLIQEYPSKQGVEDDLNDSSNNNEQNDSRNKGCKYKTTRKKGKEKLTVSLKD